MHTYAGFIVVIWSRGVSEQLMSTSLGTSSASKVRVLNVGRISKEKNLDALCVHQDEFEITIVGDGPYLNELKQNIHASISWVTAMVRH